MMPWWRAIALIAISPPAWLFYCCVVMPLYEVAEKRYEKWKRDRGPKVIRAQIISPQDEDWVYMDLEAPRDVKAEGALVPMAGWNDSSEWRE